MRERWSEQALLVERKAFVETVYVQGHRLSMDEFRFVGAGISRFCCQPIIDG